MAYLKRYGCWCGTGESQALRNMLVYMAVCHNARKRVSVYALITKTSKKAVCGTDVQYSGIHCNLFYGRNAIAGVKRGLWVAGRIRCI